MAHQVIWTRYVLDEFARLANLTEEERAIMETRVAGMSRIQQANYFNLSVSTIDKRIAILKRKYDEVQPHSELLKPRRFSYSELYQDTH